jgi:hypothetical protein
VDSKSCHQKRGMHVTWSRVAHRLLFIFDSKHQKSPSSIIAQYDKLNFASVASHANDRGTIARLPY